MMPTSLDSSSRTKRSFSKKAAESKVLEFKNTRISESEPSSITRLILKILYNPVFRDRVNYEILSVIPWVKVNRQRISQVIESILLNAEKYTHPGKEVSIVLSRIFIEDQEMVCVDIIDQGAGMTSEQLKNITSGLVRENVIGCRSDTGLRYPLIQQIMAQHEAKLEIMSQEGAGTKISLLFKAID